MISSSSKPLKETSSEVEVELTITKEWKRAKKFALVWFIAGMFCTVQAWGIINKPILSLDELQMNEGTLIKVYPGSLRVNTRIVLRKGDGSTFSVVPYGETSAYEKRIGERFKIWSENNCTFLNYICYQQMVQLQYMGTIALDYKKTILPKKEKFKSGATKYLFYLFPLFFFLLVIGTFEGIGRKVKKMKEEFNNINKG